jgi:hypothetical protein
VVESGGNVTGATLSETSPFLFSPAGELVIAIEAAGVATVVDPADGLVGEVTIAFLGEGIDEVGECVELTLDITESPSFDSSI